MLSDRESLALDLAVQTYGGLAGLAAIRELPESTSASDYARSGILQLPSWSL
jgi:hypothetical protein